jgi:hypothetical protein
MVYYKLYDRRTLAYVDGGVVRDFSVDYDYLTNNASTINLTKESGGFKGDILALSEGRTNIVLGVVTAIDNSDLKITFKHMKELFNDNVLNIFKWTNILGRKFDAVGGLKTLLEYAFVNTDDQEKKLPLDIHTFGTEPNAVYTEDDNTLNLVDFIDLLFDSYNIYLDFEIDFFNTKIICKIAKNDTEGLVIKDNIKLSSPEVDSNELPKENKLILFNKDNGNIVATYFLLTDNTVTTDKNNTNRVLPPVTKYKEWDSADANTNGYTMEEVAKSELCGNIFNHCILYKLAKNQTMVKAQNFRYGDKVEIIYKDRTYISIFTGLRFKMTDSFYTCYFGKTRIDFTDRMKLYNARKFKKK